ncbi:hypothetical protein VDGE_01069 [Verticillium dahliae]|uniref:Uncharacterized protein n=1 Tax=Verticillium dahliae TaxID=27337 RepID=A0A444SA26_VERDA|nr:hypothetical protein VDGE_01069 [Verticillium dahliae]
MTVDKTAIGSSAPTGASNSDTAQTRPRPNARQQSGTAFSSDSFSLPDLEAETEAPPAYGELHDQIQLSQSGIQAGASVTEDGRVNININQKNRRLTDLLAPTLRQQLAENVDDAPLPPAYIPPSLGGQPGQTPPPPMNIVIQIVGSRGDVQPFVALGKILLEYGHRVRIATHATFQSFVEDAGLEFFCIGGDPAELMAFMVKNPGLMPGFDALKNGEISKRRKGIQDILLGCWRSCIEAGNGLGPPPKKHRRDQPLEETEVFRPGDQRPFVADAIIANPPSFAHIHIAEKLGIPLHMMFTMPWSPTRAFPHPLANIQSTNTDAVMTSYLSYALVEMMTWQGLGDVINRFRAKALDLDPISLIWAPGLLTRLRIPYTYCWSPALIPKPNDWGNNIDISGFFFLNLASSFTPDPNLAAFLEAGPPPVYIGFGSIVVDDPNALTTMIFEAVQATGIRALVSKGWGGLGAESIGVPDGVFMLGNVPHDWLFKHVSAVCHHGGAGTSAAGIQAGKPTIVVPFFGDQPFWGAMVERAGAGPAPIPYKDLTSEKLADALKYCMKSETQARAQELGDKIREEKGSEEGGKSFHRHLNVDDLRCALAPSRTAAWRVRRTQVALSPLAAAVLVNKQQIKYTDLKLFRPKEYNTEEQPWDPVSAVTCSLVADISSIGMAIADFPRELFKSRPKSKKEESGPSTPQADSTPTGSSGERGSSQQALTSDSLSSLQHPTVQEDAEYLKAELQGTESSQIMSSNSSTFSGPAASSQTQLTHTESTASTEELGTNADRLKPQDNKPSSTRKTSSSSGFKLDETAERVMGASESVGRIVTTGVKSPMNFCLGLARGFRNVPKLYGDETVRPVEKVTDLPTGLKVAGKEFGLGLYDGISGLVTQPLRGAQKEGGAGLAKGFAKGIGGIMTKPAAAFWSIPAYTMQGVHASLRNQFASSVQNYIIASRIKQGELELTDSLPEQHEDILVRWNKVKYDLRKWHALKIKEQKEEEKRQRAERQARGEPAELPGEDEPPRTGFSYTKHLSFDERKALHARKNKSQTSQVDLQIPSFLSEQGRAASSSSAHSKAEDEDYERAIQASVAETSRGNPEEDAHVEQAIRASVNQMRSSGHGLPGTNHPAADSDEGEEDLQITDQEYQELIEKAMQQSLTMSSAGIRPGEGAPDDDEDFKRALEASKILSGEAHGDTHEDDLKRAIEASKSSNLADHDEELRRAIEESKTAHDDHRQKDQAARTEEDIVLEYVKKQSLAEDSFRSQHGKGKARVEDEDENDEDLRKAMEESLKMGRPDQGAGGSSA